MDKKVIKYYFDLHVHCGPEAIPRKYDFLELSMLIKESNMSGAVVKSHFHSTAPWVYMAAAHGHSNLFGALVLNHYVGGINPHAVFASLGLEYQGKPCLKIVWMPTLHAKGHYDMQVKHGQEYDIPLEWTGNVPAKGRQKLSKIRPINIFEPKTNKKLHQVLEVLAENELILATGHLTRDEVLYLVPEAVKKGVKKIIITHPVYEATRLNTEDLLELVKFEGVYVEQSYALVLIDNLPISQIVQQIKSVGAKHTILTGDLGQKQIIDPPEGMEEYFELLINEGITASEIEEMVCHNPRFLLGI